MDHLAQLNIARARFDYDTPEMAEFRRGVDLVNGAADRFAGFVWRLADESGGMNRGDNPRDIINLSVWIDEGALCEFLERTVHRHFFVRKADWFLPPDQPSAVFWRIRKDHRPTLAEGMERLSDLRMNGPSDRAFGWESFRSKATA